ncbi:PTS transporter subunit EIIC [Aerococcus kribbianus]|uniref:PTS transporter subunit EIIC n=1 Tax=Aerococcus kribbianus TaxID=2999064 RepID=A0A9X3FM90_9LACT|nr:MULTISPECIES: PTS transporter subunit EIIC [unclassified Aerococcus]MCZ0717132.1 PTS transporter subunit EIIC [Aerococcus sp. YH-aer221]MCZ0725420.1 PTS transporter subunit EIIC [Aerococcus sp. YH-aer222]
MAQASQDTQPSVFEKVLNALRDIFAPNLIALMGAGILQGILIILQSTGVVQSNTAEEFILSHISEAIFYFLPVLLAYSSAAVFGTNKVLAAAVALFLVHPEVVQETSNFTPNSDFFFIPIVDGGTYTNSVIPIILIVWAQSYIEKACEKWIPEIVRGVFLPVILLSLTAIIGILILGPIGNFLGDLLGAAIAWLTGVANWIVPVILGAFGTFIVMAGGHYTLFPISTQLLATVGFDNVMTPGLLASNMALAGAALATTIKTNNQSFRSYSLSATVTAALGVSQPALYGIIVPMRPALIASIIGGGLGGLYAGLTNFVFYAFVNPGVAAIPAFFAPDGSIANFVNGVITMVIAFVVAFLYVFFMPYQDLKDKEIEEITAD